jgi:phosphopantothenoylcysteine decarboxylase/phosphopantothenate--cysteine ligase
MEKNILLGVTGSIASYKACDLVRLFKKKGHSVRCVMSRDAKWFVTPLTLETLTEKEVVRKMFPPSGKRSPVHISLADEADLIVIAPATADIISKLAAGICDEILTCTVFAAACPVVLAPAMNDNMYNNPVIQDKIAYLREKGYHFVDPVVGNLACGREGIGHLAPLDKIVERAESILA